MKTFNQPIFIDSGAHGLYTEHMIKKGHKLGYSWYETDEFTKYLDEYAGFIKLNKDKIQYYANVDVIFNPKLTWESQMYLEEEHGLSPIPVIHFGTEGKWVERYLKKGYDYIALGGLGQEAQKTDYIRWADNIFSIICNTPSHVPTVKVHGFAMTSHVLMCRYPWWSVDSKTWLSLAMYGQLIVPPYLKGEWRYDIPFNTIRVSDTRSKVKRRAEFHVKRIVQQYIDEKGFKLGKIAEENGEIKVIEEGVQNSTDIRGTLNALYFIDLCNHLPKWPWMFTQQTKLML